MSALLIIMVHPTLTIMTILFHFKMWRRGKTTAPTRTRRHSRATGDSSSALGLLVVTSPFMLMGINQLSQSHRGPASNKQSPESSPSKDKIGKCGVELLLFRSPLLRHQPSALLLPPTPSFSFLTFVFTWGTWIWFGYRLRAKLAQNLDVLCACIY